MHFVRFRHRYSTLPSDKSCQTQCHEASSPGVKQRSVLSTCSSSKKQSAFTLNTLKMVAGGRATWEISFILSDCFYMQTSNSILDLFKMAAVSIRIYGEVVWGFIGLGIVNYASSVGVLSLFKGFISSIVSNAF